MPLDFRRNTPPPLISPKDQVRILILLGLMVLVFVAMRTLGRPKAWEWMLPKQARPPATGAVAEPEAIVGSEAPREDQAEAQTDAVPSAEDAATNESDLSSPAGRGESPVGAFGLELSRLSSVRDNTPVRLRANEEAEPYYYLLDLARRIDPARFEAAARRDLTYAQFLTAPGKYRGELVHVQGALKRLIQYPAGPNDYGIEQLYEGWLFTEDSYNNPYVVICTQIPEGMPMGNISQRVRLAGYFFKNNAYEAGDARRVAPMILAHRLIWRRPAAEAAGPDPLKLFPWLLAASLIAAGALMFWMHRRHAAFRADRHLPTTPEAIGAPLQGEAAPEPDEFLEQLSHEAADQDGGSHTPTDS